MAFQSAPAPRRRHEPALSTPRSRMIRVIARVSTPDRPGMFAAFKKGVEIAFAAGGEGSRPMSRCSRKAGPAALKIRGSPRSCR